jgi:heme/copper-type cytochrome/quinol oxidase subunit 3
VVTQEAYAYRQAFGDGTGDNRGESNVSDAHPAHVAHQFDSAEQQRQASSLGMWIFLVTEVMFFGGLFAGYTIYRGFIPKPGWWAVICSTSSWVALIPRFCWPPV